MVTLLEKTGELNLIEKEKRNTNILEKYLLTNMPIEKWITVEEKGNENPEITKRVYTVLPMELANFIRKNLNYFFVRGNAMEKPLIYVYMDGVYKNVSDEEFKGFIKSFIPYQLRKTKEINEIFCDLTTDLKFISYEKLDADENIINFEDGILNIDTMKLLPHSPQIYSTIQIPARYRDIESCEEPATVFEGYMMNLVDGSTDAYMMLMEIIGLIMSNIPCSRTKKSLMLCGAGDTGKSQLKRLVEELIGHNNVSTVDLKNLNEKFGTANLYKKRLAGSNDMSFQRITDMSIYKQVTGGDKITVEFKHKGSFPYEYKGFLWFNCNKLPLFGGDDGKWVYDRMLIIYCKNVIPNEKKDPEIFNKMWKERNMIIKQALYFLNQLRANKFKFTIPAEMAELREQYEIENNTLLSFIEECCDRVTLLATRRLKKTEFKRVYYRWVDYNNGGKGKLKNKEIEDTLKNRYEFKIKKYDGYDQIEGLIIKDETYRELGMSDWRE